MRLSRILLVALLLLAGVAAIALVTRRSSPVSSVPLPAPAGPVIEPLPGPATGFGGRWVGPCSLTSKCAGEPSSVDEDQLDLEIRVVGATLEVSRDGCRYVFDVRGQTASLRAGQHCRDAPGDVQAWTVTLQASEQELATTLRSRVSAAPGVSCSSRATGVLHRK